MCFAQSTLCPPHTDAELTERCTHLTAARGQFIPARRLVCLVTLDDFSVTGIRAVMLGKEVA